MLTTEKKRLWKAVWFMSENPPNPNGPGGSDDDDDDKDEEPRET